MVHEGEARPGERSGIGRRRQDDPRRSALHAYLGGLRHLCADADRNGRGLLRRTHQLCSPEQPAPRRLCEELHERVVHREAGLRLQGRSLLRLQRLDALVRHLDVDVRDRRRAARWTARDDAGESQARPDTSRSAVGLPADEDPLLAVHAGDGREHHRDPRRSVHAGRQDRGRDGPARQGDDDRVCGRPDAAHDRWSAHPRGRPAPAPPREHRPPRRRHERGTRPREHPGQHRSRDQLGDPSGLSAHPRARTEEPGPVRGGQCREEERPQFMELLRDELPELHGESPQGVVRQQGHQGQRWSVCCSPA